MSTIAQERKLVNRLSKIMLAKLRDNASRGHWKNSGVAYYFKQIRDNLKLFERAILLCDDHLAMSSAADIANFSAMILDNRIWSNSEKNRRISSLVEFGKSMGKPNMRADHLLYRLRKYTEE